MDPILNIVTPASRLDNLPVVAGSILRELNPHFTVRWFCVPNEGCPYGGKPRNVALDAMRPEGWLYFLDDDNLVTPGFGDVLRREIQADPTVDMFLFEPLVKPDGRLHFRTPVSDMKYGQFDTAQFVLRASLLGDIRWIEGHPGGDHKLATEFVQKRSPKISVVNFAVTYNTLRPT